MLLMLLLLLPANVRGMYDVLLDSSRALPPAECPHGCALWANLSADGNTRDQTTVNDKFRFLAPPPSAGRSCAMPAYDPGELGLGWCYCRASLDSSWGNCLPLRGSVPEQLNLQWVADDAYSLGFVTFDGYAPSAPTVLLATSPDLANGRVISGVTNYWAQEGSTRQYSFHFVPLTGLLPATTYFYAASSGAQGGVRSAVYSFTTRDPAAPLKFGIFGDMGVFPVNNMDVLHNDSSISLVVHMGDHAYQMSSDDGAHGDGYMIAWEGVLTKKPWLAVMGNQLSAYRSPSTPDHAPSRLHSHAHTLTLPFPRSEEYNGAFFMRYLNQTAGMAAPSPRRGSSGAANGRWYSVNIGLLHLVVLDFNVYYGSEPDALRVQQLEWLEADLSSVDRSRTPWILATAHMPIQCSSITYDGAFVSEAHKFRAATGEAPQRIAASAPYAGCIGTGVANTEASRKDVEPLLLRYGVDLFTAGHEHNYESMWPTRNLQPVQKNFEQPQAPIYVVDGAGGAPALDLFGGPGPFTRLQDSSWGWGRVTVHNASHLTYERVQNDRCRQQCQASECPACGLPAGAVLDSWTVHQLNHGPFAA